jgi:hypothetical protein
MSDAPRFLFRYRNLLTDDTLGEHRAIIDREGSCWWGWWQRPAEDTRSEFWNELMREAQRGPVEIALFDSDPDTRGSVHVAKLVEVIPPGEQGRAPRIPEDELHLVPSYYRETPFSSAWMRLNKIANEPLAPADFYRHHAFRRPPQLAHIDPKQRERFLDKLVLDADELRSMDTTIWELRKARAGDRDERILTASSRVTEALSPQPILLRSGWVLHLSDLHFTSKAGRRMEHRWQLINEGTSTLHERILHALRQELGSEPEIGLVVISGDLTYRASRDEFYEAFPLSSERGRLNLGDWDTT